MKTKLVPSIVAGVFLVCGLAAVGQTQSADNSNTLVLPTHGHNTPENSRYDYDFISKGYVWSNRPLNTTAGKICKTMKDRSFAETPYAINGDKDWNACLDMQIRSIGYMRWLKNAGFRPTSKNRKNAQAYLKKNYTMGEWGGYTFAQLSQAVKSTYNGRFQP